MLHIDRTWSVTPAASREELARMLIETTWCCCNGFEFDRYLFLNDSTSPDGIQEYAIVHKHADGGSFLQLESITVGWCDEPQMLHYINAALMGEYALSDFVHEVFPKIQTPEEHGRCPHCA